MILKPLQCYIIDNPLGNPIVQFEVEINDDLNKVSALQDKDLKGYELTIKKPRQKSMTANSYMWRICDKIAHRIGSTKEDVYRAAIREVGVYDDVLVKTEAYEDFKRVWEDGHLGYFVEPIGMLNGEEYISVRTYYGSSNYNSQELSRVVDYIVDEAKGMGIETITDREMERLLSLVGK